MPAAHDIYAEQLRELRRGQPLYYPEPSSEDGPVEIGDVGYTRQGAFCRLFNVAKPANDPSQVFGIPEGFQPLDIGRIMTYDAALEPGPLHSKTVFRVSADVGTNAALVLPANASFRFSCSSARGAILMLEGQMNRQQVFHDNRLKNYLLQHCLSWYEFARNLGVQVDFGDIMVVTECSKTAAWASVVYSQSSRDFGMSFSAGGLFVPSASGDIAVSVGLERIGPVEHRRSQRKAINREEIETATKDQTVFIRGYRLGSRSLYMRSIARKIIKTTNLTRQGPDAPSLHSSTIGFIDTSGQCTSTPSSPTVVQRGRSRAQSASASTITSASALMPECSDFHPAVALLAHTMETTNVRIAVVHDDDWCSTFSEKTTSIVDKYARAFFMKAGEDGILIPSKYTQPMGDSLLSLISIAKSDAVSATHVLTGQSFLGDKSNTSISFQLSEVTLLRELPPLLERPSLHSRSKSEPTDMGRDQPHEEARRAKDDIGAPTPNRAVDAEEMERERNTAHKNANRNSRCIIM